MTEDTKPQEETEKKEEQVDVTVFPAPIAATVKAT